MCYVGTQTIRIFILLVEVKVYSKMKEKEEFGFLDMKELRWLMNNPKLNWLRWILVIPFALLGYGIILLLQGLENWFYEPPIWFITYLQSPVFSFGSAFAFVMVGTEMAPMHKKTSGLILLLISIMIFGVLIFLAIEAHLYKSFIYIIPGILGAFLSYKMVESQYENKL